MAKRLDVDRDEVISFYQSTGSPKKTSEKFGVPVSTIDNWLNQARVERIGQSGVARKLPDYQLLRKEYDSGASLNELAAKYGATARTVHEALVKIGTKMRPRGNMAKILTPEQEKLLLALYGKFGNQTTVAEQMGISQPVVSRHLRSLGIYDDKKASRERHRSWKGGKVKISGYVGALVDYDDPMRVMAQRSGYVMEHRLVMARHIGRPLDRHETVHHVNGDTADNRIENLQLRSGQHGHGVVHRCRDCGSTNIESTSLKG